VFASPTKGIRRPELISRSAEIRPVLNDSLPPPTLRALFDTHGVQPKYNISPVKARSGLARASSNTTLPLPLPKGIDELTVANKMLVDRLGSAAALSRNPPHNHATRSDHKKDVSSATEWIAGLRSSRPRSNAACFIQRIWYCDDSGRELRSGSASEGGRPNADPFLGSRQAMAGTCNRQSRRRQDCARPRWKARLAPPLSIVRIVTWIPCRIGAS
jgi:hypothetical protein